MSNGQYPPGPFPGQVPNPYPTQQPQPAQPQQGWGGAVPPAPAPVPGQGGFPSASQPPGGQLPQYHLPDDQAVLQAYQQHREAVANFGSGDGSGPQYVKFLDPQGGTNWSIAQPGWESSLYVYFLPPWGPGKNIFRTVKSHFWKSYANPRGTSIGCPGPETCLICQAREAAASSMDPAVQKRAKDFGRTRTQHLYNVVILDNPNGHFGKDGLMKPFILGAGMNLHKAIGDIIEDKHGAINVVDPMRGRPIRLKKTKTGPAMMDVAYAAIAQDPAPLPPQFYPALQNVWDLDKQDRMPQHEDMVKAVQEMGLPLPLGMNQPAGGYQQAPAPANPNPYQGAVGGPQAPVYMPPPADPYEFPPQDAYSQPAPQPPVQQSWAPPSMATPPPVSSTPQGAPQAPPAAPAIPTQSPPWGSPPQAVSGGPQGQIPPAPAVTQPNLSAQPVRQPIQAQAQGRPPCFGKHNAQDRMCQGCPDALKNECVAQMGQQQAPAQEPQAQDLAQLQAQLTGGQK